MTTKLNVVSSHAIPMHLCTPNFALTGSRYDHFTGTLLILHAKVPSYLSFCVYLYTFPFLWPHQNALTPSIYHFLFSLEVELVTLAFNWNSLVIRTIVAIVSFKQKCINSLQVCQAAKSYLGSLQYWQTYRMCFTIPQYLFPIRRQQHIYIYRNMHV